MYVSAGSVTNSVMKSKYVLEGNPIHLPLTNLQNSVNVSNEIEDTNVNIVFWWSKMVAVMGLLETRCPIT